MQSKQQTIEAAVHEIADWINGTPAVMLTTRNAEGRLVSRPLAVRSVPFDGSAWFLTALGSTKLREIEADPRVNLAFVNTGNGAYVSMEGRARVTTDRSRIAMLWSDSIDAMFFPAGRDDPHLAALCVEADTVEVWTSASTAIGRMIDTAMASLTGDSGQLGVQIHYDLRHGLRTEKSR